MERTLVRSGAATTGKIVEAMITSVRPLVICRPQTAMRRSSSGSELLSC